MTTIAILTVLSPAILITIVAIAGVLALYIALFIARVLFWLAIGGLIGLALWAGEARAEQHTDLPRLNFNGGVLIPLGHGLIWENGDELRNRWIGVAGGTNSVVTINTRTS